MWKSTKKAGKGHKVEASLSLSDLPLVLSTACPDFCACVSVIRSVVRLSLEPLSEAKLLSILILKVSMLASCSMCPEYLSSVL